MSYRNAYFKRNGVHDNDNGWYRCLKSGKVMLALLLTSCVINTTSCGDGRKDVPKSKDIEKNYTVEGLDGEPIKNLLENDGETENLESKKSETSNSKQAENKEIEDIKEEPDELDTSQIIEEVESLSGLGGAYKDEETGQRIAIAAIGNEWSYCIYDTDGTVFQSESNCDMSEENGGYISGQYCYIGKNSNGTLEMSHGLAESWGNFIRVSGTTNPTPKIEGRYTDGSTTILVTEQMADCGNENIPGGADIASVYIEYSNGGAKIQAHLYTQQDGSLAVVDNTTKALRGIITFKNKTAVVTGSDFDGAYQLSE